MNDAAPSAKQPCASAPVWFSGLVLPVLMAGCNLSIDERPTAFHERDFAADPDLAAEIDDIVLLHLEAAGDHEGDTGNEIGVDEIPYVLTESVTLTLEIDVEGSPSHSVVLHDPDGNEILTVVGNAQASTTTTLPEGRYTVRIHHAQKGEADAERQLLFLGPAETEISTLRTGRIADSVQDPSLRASRRRLPVKSSSVKHLKLRDRCDRCTFTNANFDGLDLSNARVPASHWINCSLNGTNLSNALMTGSTGPVIGSGLIGVNIAPVFDGCSLRGAVLDGASMIGVLIHNNCDLSGASLNNATFVDPASGENPLCGSELLCIFSAQIENSIFNGADLSGADLSGATLKNNSFDGATLNGTILDRTALFDGNTFDGTKWSGSILRDIDFRPIALRSLSVDWSDCDFTGSNLTDQDLSGLDLSGATISGADITGASFANANLQNADLTGLDMRKNDLASADVEGANMTDCILDALDWTGKNLRGAILTNASMTSVVLAGADLTNANLSGAKCFEANLDGAKLLQANLQGARLDFADLRNADLQGAVLGAANPNAATVATLNNAYMPNVNLQDADLRSVDFSNAHLYGDQANIQNALLQAADFTGAIVSGMDFTNVKATDVVFNNAQLVNCKFTSATLENAKFDKAYLQGAQFNQAVLTGTNLTNAAFSFDTGTWMFTDQDGMPYTIVFGATLLGDTTDATCPNGTPGPCATDEQLMPIGDNGPFPEIPECVPSPTAWCPPPSS